MSEDYTASGSLPNFSLWEKTAEKRIPYSFDLELTARCNNDCRHCYINLPAGDKEAQHRELNIAEIDSIASQAVEMGALWCLITGGEPLLRKDFEEIYLLLKRKGLLISVFTNGCLINAEHVELFKNYPPRDVEVTIYGATEETYERVTRKPGSYAAFRRGVDLLLNAGVKVRFKAMAIRSTAAELPAIAKLGRELTKDYFRFDPLLHLRYDSDPIRNAEIRKERLTAEEIVAIEQADEERAISMQKNCNDLINPAFEHTACNHLFHCGAGVREFTVSYDGKFQLCSSLHHPETVYDLRKGTLAEAWNEFVPKIRDLRSDKPEFIGKCRSCALINLCLWCPAHAALESGEMDSWNEYFCQVAHARADAIRPNQA